MRRRNGFALLAVLWGTVLLGLLAANLATTARTEARLARNLADQAQRQAALDGAVRLTVAELAATPSALRRDGTPRTVAVAGWPVTVTAVEAGGLIDLNAASPILLGALFRAAGADPARAARLTDAVLDWRDTDSVPRPHGAEAADYAAARLPPPGNRRFETVAELRRVLGVDEPLYAAAARYATVQARQSGIDPRVAPVELLLAIPGADPAAVAALAARRPLPPNAILPKLGLPRELLATSLGDVVEVVAASADGGPYRRATVRLTGLPADPVWLHGWEAGP